MKTEIVSRISTVLDVLNISPNDLSNKSGYKSNSQIYRMLAGKWPVSLQVVEGLHSYHPEINLDWLITGRGTMFMTKYYEPKIPMANETPEPYTSKEIKLVMIKHQGMYIENYDHAEFIQSLPSINDTKYTETHRDFKSSSNVPDTNIQPDDIVRCKKIQLPKLFQMATSPDFNAVIVTIGNIIMGKSRVKNDSIIITNHKTITTIPREDINEVWEITDVLKSATV